MNQDDAQHQGSGDHVPVDPTAVPPSDTFPAPPDLRDPLAPPPIPEPPATEPIGKSEADDEEGGGKVKAAALLAGAAALANKLRQEAPKKVQELREKRAAGQCVILTESEGRSVAIGPYRDEATAYEDISRAPVGARVVELMTEGAFFASRASGPADRDPTGT